MNKTYGKGSNIFLVQKQHQKNKKKIKEIKPKVNNSFI